ncbi:MarR family transcriptional regulator [Acetobacter tropicalis NRIC 0312]|uniref:Transcriptional regulator n=1 Tax=Acetobacter tropicalis TaxID=104102 RepID=A0A511FML2_9PROT|nr:MarR family transcriptional regulator [Acetobacter tropicalis]KXV46434.1 MarR family transcriptional regulator [Acetobacter tropicalis]GAL97590.1 marR family transcriptional regulator [Acetobacter tropicalis]GBR71405.1 MarR family transcriptional regulator [Acetobacter tropicalis NRIC 0312]GEL50097.1 transcriptional regulator [Acetobacter tropicalis]
MEPDHDSANSHEIRRSFGYRLARLASVWRREIDADLREFGLTDATWRPIYYLNFSSAPVRQTDLARSLSLEAPSLVRLLDVLEKRGFIVREIDEDDRRSKLVSITEEGRDVAALVSRAADEVTNRLTADVSSAELEQCCHIFDRVEQAAVGQKEPPASEREHAR